MVPPRAATWLAVLAAAASGLAAGLVLLPGEVRVTARGDWRAVSEGLRRWPDRESVVSGPRFVIHAHELAARATALRVHLRSNPGASPVRLHVLPAPLGVAPTWTLTEAPQSLTFAIRPGDRGLDVVFDAESDAPPARARLIVDAVVVESPTSPAVVAARLLPPLVGALVAGGLWSRGRRLTAFGWSVLASSVTAVALACAVEPAALLAFDPATRDAGRLAAVALLWALALAEPPSRLTTAITIVSTVALLYGPTLGFGLLSDDFLWARPWTARELLGAFAGPEDPLARTTGTYRPTADLTRAVDHALWGVGAAGAHLTNLVLLATAGILAAALGRRLGLGPRGATVLAATWIAHPLSASSAAWASQRTDTLAAIFFLGALVVLLAARLDRARAATTVVLGALALASKEIAVVLPVAAWAATHAADLPHDRERRRTVLRVLVLLVAAYVALWAGLFPEKMLRGETQRGAWLGFDPRQPGDWLRLLPLLYGTVFLPRGYEHWFRTGLREWPLLHLALAAALVAALLVAARRWWPEPSARVLAVGLVWPLVVIIPILGARPDLYRLGLFPALALGFAGAAVIARLERVRPWLPSLAAVAVALVLLPVTFEVVRAWRPEGFFAARAIEWSRRHTDWQQELTPEARALFLAQLERQDHARRLLDGEP